MPAHSSHRGPIALTVAAVAVVLGLLFLIRGKPAQEDAPSTATAAAPTPNLKTESSEKSDRPVTIDPPHASKPAPEVPAAPTTPVRMEAHYRGVPASGWIAILNGPNAKQRAQAMDALSMIGKDAPEAVPHLLKLMRTGDPGTRLSAMRALGGFGALAKDAVPDLIAVVSARADETEYAIKALGQIGPEASGAVELISPFIYGTGPYQDASIEALARIGGKGARALLDAARIATNNNGAPSSLLLRALPSAGTEAVPLLTELVENGRCNLETVSALARLGEVAKDAGSALAKSLAAREPERWPIAAWGLARIDLAFLGTESDREKLASELVQIMAQVDSPAREGAVEALAALNQAGIAELKRALESGGVRMRAGVAQVVGKMAGEAQSRTLAKELLTEILRQTADTSEHILVRRTGVQCLAAFVPYDDCPQEVLRFLLQTGEKAGGDAQVVRWAKTGLRNRDRVVRILPAPARPAALPVLPPEEEF